jgi:hypothetical protein
MAALSGTWAFIARTLGSWVRIPLKAWKFVLPFCVVLSCVGKRSCDELVTRPVSPTKCLNGFIISEVILNWNMSQGFNQ